MGRLPRRAPAGLLPLLSFLAASTFAGAVTELASQQVGEACLTALATQEGRPREEVIAALNDALASGATSSDSCDLAVATASPVGIYLRAFGTWLEHPEPIYQLAVSFVAICAGLACCWDGPAIWRALFTATAAFAAAVVTYHEANLWGLAPNFISELVLMAQAMAAVALAVHVGFEGSQVLFGVLLGLIGAYGLGDGVRSLEHTAPGLSLLWYEVGAVFGFLMYTVWRKAVLSTLAPLIGGFLVTVGSCVLLSRAFGAVAGPYGVGDLAILPPHDAPWLTAARALLGNAGGYALPVHCAWAMLATMVHGCIEIPIVTVVCLLASLLLTAVSASTACLCQLWPMKAHLDGDCPEWLRPVSNWQWPVFGCLLWAGLTGVSAWRQLRMLKEWEEKNFWRSELYASVTPNDDGSVRRITSVEDGSPGNFRTKMPAAFHDPAHGQVYGFNPMLEPRSPSPSIGSDNPLAGLVQGMGQWWAEVNGRRWP